MASFDKLPSGKWRARVSYQENGKRKTVSFTANTKAEVSRMVLEHEAIKEKDVPSKKLLKDVIQEYIDISEVLGETTLSGYRRIAEHAFKDIMYEKAASLTDKDMQVAINNEARRLNEKTGKQISAKTVKNEWGLISAAMKTLYGKTYAIKLPKIQHKNEDLPDPALILEAISGSPVELPCLLAMEMGMRMEEIRGLMCSSIKGDTIYIDSVIVDVDNVEVRKELAKTDSSIRKLKIQPDVMLLIESLPNYQEYIKNGVDSRLLPLTRNKIYHHYKKLMNANGLNLSFHDLRHVYASVCLNILQLPEKVVMDNGGWKTSAVMKKVYSQSFTKVRKESDEKVGNYFRSIKDRSN